jgi:hypothetical protein
MLPFASSCKGALKAVERTSKMTVKKTVEMNSTKTRSGQTRTSSSRSRRGRGLACGRLELAAVVGLFATRLCPFAVVGRRADTVLQALRLPPATEEVHPDEAKHRAGKDKDDFKVAG